MMNASYDVALHSVFLWVNYPCKKAGTWQAHFGEKSGAHLTLSQVVYAKDRGRQSSGELEKKARTKTKQLNEYYCQESFISIKMSS